MQILNTNIGTTPRPWMNVQTPIFDPARVALPSADLGVNALVDLAAQVPYYLLNDDEAGTARVFADISAGPSTTQSAKRFAATPETHKLSLDSGLLIPTAGMKLGLRTLTIPADLERRILELEKPGRPGTVPLPAYIGRPGMAMSSDAHGEVETGIALHGALPRDLFRYDLGDKVDRGESPESQNYLLQTLRVQRTLGNHDAMWLAAGIGIRELGIELIRWLLRYNEMDFLTTQLGIKLQPLRAYAEKHFSNGKSRIEVKSKVSKEMEAAATYLKIIAEAGTRFPEHKDVFLNDAEMRMRNALFFTAAASELRGGEREIFARLTGNETLSAEDVALFEKLMGGLRTLNEEEQAIIDHFALEFMNSYEFYQFVTWMIGDGDLYVTRRRRQGYPVDIIATHASIPIDENGNLKPFLGKTGHDMMIDVTNRIKMAMEAWRQYQKHGNPTLFQMYADVITPLGRLAWDKESPLYDRVMKTAARAVLKEGTGTWAEPRGHFARTFEKSTDMGFLNRVYNNIATSYGVDPQKFVIVRGHEPSPDGMFQLRAGGRVINIDGGMSKRYLGKGGLIVFGSEGAAWLSYPDLKYTQVPLP